MLGSMSDEELSARIDAAAYLASAATYLDRYTTRSRTPNGTQARSRSRPSPHTRRCFGAGGRRTSCAAARRGRQVLDDGVEAARLVGIPRAWPGCCATAPCSRSSPPTLPAGPRDGRGGSGADATARREHPVSLGALAVARASVMAGRSQRAVDVLGGGEQARCRFPRLAGHGPRGLDDGLCGPRPRRRGRANRGDRRSARGRPGSPDGHSLGAAAAATVATCTPAIPARPPNGALASATARGGGRCRHRGRVVRACSPGERWPQPARATARRLRSSARRATFESWRRPSSPRCRRARAAPQWVGRAPPHAAGAAGADGLAALSERELRSPPRRRPQGPTRRSQLSCFSA